MPDASSLMTMQQIRHLYNLQKANVTANYDSTATYEIGDYCLYLGILYRCISTISTAEDFDSSHWVSTNVDAELDRIETSLRINPLVIDIPSGQWSGSGNDYYYTVTASNVTANSILVPNYDGASAGYLRGPVWCVPAAGSFTIHTSAIPSGTVKIMVQIVGTMGEANYQVLSDVYSTSQTYSKTEAVAKADIVNNLTSTSTTAPLSAAMGKALNEKIKSATVTITTSSAGVAGLLSNSKVVYAIVCNTANVYPMFVPFIGTNGTTYAMVFDYSTTAVTKLVNTQLNVTVYYQDLPA